MVSIIILVILLYVAISASRYDGSDPPVNNEGLNFPSTEDLANFATDIEPVMVQVPFEVIQERLQGQNRGNNIMVEIIIYDYNVCSQLD